MWFEAISYIFFWSVCFYHIINVFIENSEEPTFNLIRYEKNK